MLATTNPQICSDMYVFLQPFESGLPVETRCTVVFDTLRVRANVIDHAFDAAALISSAPSKLVPCSLPKAPAAQASATLSLDTGGDSATCSNTAIEHDISMSKNVSERASDSTQGNGRRVASTSLNTARATGKRHTYENLIFAVEIDQHKERILDCRIRT